MKYEQIRRMSPTSRLLYWIQERQNIYLRRRLGWPKPWSEDPIFQTTYFTNVYRELDKVTVWFRDNIRDPLHNDPRVLFATIAFRWFNWPATGSLLLGKTMEDWDTTWPRTNLLLDWNTRECVSRLNALKNIGGQVFTGAFNISNSGSTKSKINRVCEDYIQPAWEQQAAIAEGFDRLRSSSTLSLAAGHKILSKLPGLGGSGFMAAQVVADLKYTYLLSTYYCRDWWSWCSPGPGSIKGLNIVLGKDPNGPCPKDFLEEIHKLQQLVRSELPHLKPLHAQDLQNTLCETFKYERVLAGGGTKRKYDGV